MATRQRSFFDAQPPARRWSSHYRTPRVSKPPAPEPVRTLAAIPASTASRDKLRAFALTEWPLDGADPAVPSPKFEAGGQQSTMAQPMQPPSNTNSSSQQIVREFPQTPLGRVPLADLIDVQDASQPTPNASPMDFVEWDHSPPDTQDLASCVTPAARRGKRRTHSSSPTRSQGGPNVPKVAFDLNNSESALGPPCLDPALDLETKYFSRATAAPPSRPPASAAAELMQSSSPRTPAIESGKNAKLRRTVSCGLEWPTAKRRKVSAATSTPSRPDTRHTAPHPGRDFPLKSIDLLLDKIHSDLHSHPDHSITKTLAPQQDRGVRKAYVDLVPPVAESRPSSTNLAATIQLCQEDQRARRSSPKPQAQHCSEFDDEDLDFSLLSNLMSLTPSRALSEPVEIAIDQLPPLSREKRENDSGALSHPTAPQNAAEAMTSDDFDDAEFAAGVDEVTQALEAIARSEPAVDRKLQTSQPRRHQPSNLETAAAVGLDECWDISSEEDFEGAFSLAEIDAATGASATSQSASQSIESSKIVPRYRILSISETASEFDKSMICEKVLLVQELRSQRTQAVILRQSWLDTPCIVGDIVHVVGPFDVTGQCLIDDSRNFIIMNPDHLISATVVADSFSCARRAVLQDRVKATSAASESQVYGHILHEIFQESLKTNRWDNTWFSEVIKSICSRYLESLQEIHVDLPRAYGYLMGKVPLLQSWAARFVTAGGQGNGAITDRNGDSVDMRIRKLLEVEEHVWSPSYGLKGNVDATIEVALEKSDGHKILTVPLELKTGRNSSSAAHRAQTALYTLLLSNRYDVDVTCGVLYYLETSETICIRGIRNEMLQLIKQRNALAVHLRERKSLPPMLKDVRMCGKCYAQKPCLIYHKLVEQGDEASSGAREKFRELTSHLKPAHEIFFKKWDSLLTQEESDMLKYRRELWTMLSNERERLGRCFGDLVVEPGSAVEETAAPKINRFRYTLVKSNRAKLSCSDSQLTVGEPIVISDEKGHFALANGYVTSLRSNRITVAVDRRLHNSRGRSRNFHEEVRQCFNGIMTVNKPEPDGATPSEYAEPMTTYRVDKDDFSNGMATARNNLVRLMEHDLFGAAQLRQLIVEVAAPSFKPGSRHQNDHVGSNTCASLNQDQFDAVQKVMSAEQYALVLGMPGTGKTTTIAHIIRALVAKGKSILLASYTHTAVDNILLKVRDAGMSILRLGAVAKIHPEVGSFATLASAPKHDLLDIEKSYDSQVVATTCLGVNHPIFSSRLFDYCIVDEASQITLPICLGPIRMAKKFVLVGDHYQLPPLVQNKQAQEGGLDVSLFKMLSDSHPEAIVNLEHQYRMCQDIMELSSDLIYHGRLKCANEQVANRRMVVKDWTGLRRHHHLSTTSLSQGQKAICTNWSKPSCWLQAMVDPARPVVFLNTDRLRPAAFETVKGSRITNPIELTLTVQAVQALLSVGISANEIGVITLYRSQLALLKQNLRHAARDSSHPQELAELQQQIEMHTADRFQGRDKEVVVLSLVRSNEADQVGELLQDWRRVNVALTRARTKLVIIGSFSTISHSNDLLHRLCERIQQRDCRHDLNADVVDQHIFDDWGSQLSSTFVEAPPAPSQGSQSAPQADVKRKSPKRGRIEPRRLLKNRPVMQDIMNEVFG